MVVAPKEQQASEAIYKAEGNFAKDSLRLALNGDGSSKGFLYIINNYSGTKVPTSQNTMPVFVTCAPVISTTL